MARVTVVNRIQSVELRQTVYRVVVALTGPGSTAGGGGGGSVAWGDVTGKPATFPPAPHGHSAGDIAGLSPVATSGQYSDLNGLPSLFDGTWASLTGKPATFPPAPHGHPAAQITGLSAVAISGDYSDLSGLPSLFDGTWASLTGKPATFPPSAHGHAASEISDSTAAGRALLTATDAAAQRSALAVESSAQLNARDAANRDRANHTGTQPAATITGLAAVATSGSASDLVSGTLPPARLALTKAELATAVTDGDPAYLGDAQNFTKAQGTTPVALTDGPNIATDASLSNVFTVTLGGNRTLENPTNLVAGRTYAWIITQDGNGSRTLAFGSSFDFPGGTNPVLSTGPGDVDLITGIAISTSRILCVANLDFS